MKPTIRLLVMATCGAALLFALMQGDRGGPGPARSPESPAADEGEGAGPGLVGRGKTPTDEVSDEVRDAPRDDAHAATEARLTLRIVDPEGNALDRGSVRVQWWGSDPWSIPDEPEFDPNRLLHVNYGRPSQRSAVLEVVGGTVVIPRPVDLPVMQIDVRPRGVALLGLDPFQLTRTPLLPTRLRIRDPARVHDETREVRLERGLLIQGRVLDDDGEPVDTADVRIERLADLDGTRDRKWRGDQPLKNKTTVSGHFAAGQLPPGLYGVEADALGEVARILVKGRGTRDVIVTLGKISGPHLRFVNDEGQAVELGHVRVRVKTVGSEDRERFETPVRPIGPTWVSRRIGGIEPEAKDASVVPLQPQCVGLTLEVRATGIPGAHDGTELAWTLSPGADANELRVPRTAPVNLALGAADFDLGPDGVAVTLRLADAAGTALAPAVSCVLARAGRLTSLSLPVGIYDVDVRSHSPQISSATYLRAVAAPGDTRLEPHARRTLRLRVEGAPELARFEFQVDGTRAVDAEAWRIERQDVIFDGVDAGPRTVTARWRGLRPFSDVPSSLPPIAARRLMGLAVFNGGEGVLRLTEGASLVFEAPADADRPAESEGMRMSSGIDVRVAGVLGGEVELPLFRGELLGYPEGTLVTPPLPPGRYDVKVFPGYAAYRPVTSGGSTTDWTFEGLVTGGRATALTSPR